MPEKFKNVKLDLTPVLVWAKKENDPKTWLPEQMSTPSAVLLVHAGPIALENEKIATTYVGGKPIKIKDESGKVVTINVTKITEGEQPKATLTATKGDITKKYTIDLAENPGGYVDNLGKDFGINTQFLGITYQSKTETMRAMLAIVSPSGAVHYFAAPLAMGEKTNAELDGKNVEITCIRTFGTDAENFQGAELRFKYKADGSNKYITFTRYVKPIEGSDVLGVTAEVGPFSEGSNKSITLVGLTPTETQAAELSVWNANHTATYNIYDAKTGTNLGKSISVEPGETRMVTANGSTFGVTAEFLGASYSNEDVLFAKIIIKNSAGNPINTNIVKNAGVQFTIPSLTGTIQFDGVINVTE